MRVLHFLPYYVGGLYFEEKYLNAIRYPRLVGAAGILSTLVICFQVDPNHLGHVYFVSSWKVFPHLLFCFQYLLCGIEIISSILLMRSISVPIFPFGHASSTLAIYEYHWPVVGILTWGKVPFTEIDIPGLSDPSQFVALAKHWHPLTTLFASHVISYFICVALGSTWFWRWVQPVSDPDCRFLFATANARDPTIAKADDSLPAVSFGKNGGCFDIESGPLRPHH